MADSLVTITPALKGAIVPSDLLKTEATLHFVTDAASIQQGGFIFQVIHKDFIFSLSFQNNAIVLQRNEIVSVLTLDELLRPLNRILVFVVWSANNITLDCGISPDHRKRAELQTMPIAPPIELIRWARKNNLLEVPIYTSEESFREKVYSCLDSVNDKIREADAFKSFWNIGYEGQKIISRHPKKEVELQPLIHCLLSDQMLQGNIEIIPEYKTGEGNLDFLFIANVSGVGMCKICAEFKLAHSDDRERGLLVQLPAYMDVSKAKYGAYCILNFKGEWFSKPTIKGDEKLDIYMQKVRVGSSNPAHENIRIFIFNMFKPDTASKQ